MEDKTITCRCGSSFVFTAGEQKFYAEKGLKEPKRCKKCRQEKKAAQQPKDKEWGNCESCGNYQPLTEVGMCGPCTFGEADTINGNW